VYHGGEGEDGVSDLVPKRVWIRGEFKKWGGDRESGRTAGTTLEVEFDVPDGLGGRELLRQVHEEKEKLDLAALTSEYLRGTLGGSEYRRERATIRERYAKALDREED
jgi:hypothetical protein